MRAQSSPRPGRGEAPDNPQVAARTLHVLSYKHHAPVSPLECALPRFPTTVHSKRLTRSAKSFRMRTYEKTGGRVPHPFLLPSPVYSKGNTSRLWPILNSYSIKTASPWFPASVSGACGDSSVFTSHLGSVAIPCTGHGSLATGHFSRAYFGSGSAAGERTSRNSARTSEMRKGFCKKSGSPRAGVSGPVSVRSPVM